MSAREPVTAQPYLRSDTRPGVSWSSLLRRVAESKTFWLATSRTGPPHVMPLLAVCVEEKIYFCAGPKTQKARNLARDSRCVLTTAAGGVAGDLWPGRTQPRRPCARGPDRTGGGRAREPAAQPRCGRDVGRGRRQVELVPSRRRRCPAPARGHPRLARRP